MSDSDTAWRVRRHFWRGLAVREPNLGSIEHWQGARSEPRVVRYFRVQGTCACVGLVPDDGRLMELGFGQRVDADELQTLFRDVCLMDATMLVGGERWKLVANMFVGVPILCAMT